MSKIKLLDELTIQKIAAGEVIENPASIVKELVENSIDAESKNIVVEITKGGKESIRVTDDGIGMNKEDLYLAFKRHSTSKLRDINDIYNIMSLGFRGEALASVSSVANVEVLTKTENKDAGLRAIVENGEIVNIESVGTPVGTTMLIKNLFYNLPVRKKFLKADVAEANNIDTTVTRLALGNPNVGFRLIRDSKVTVNTSPSNDLKNTIYMVLGKDMATNLIKVDYKDEYISLNGYITNNKYSRGNRSYQYLYINGRYIQNSKISNSIENKYKSLIPINRFPGFVLNLNIDPGEIDVNIHPTKQEVKFTQRDRVIATVGDVIKEVLLESLTIPKVGRTTKDNNTEITELKVIEKLDSLDEDSSYENNNKDMKFKTDGYSFNKFNNTEKLDRSPYNPNYFKEDDNNSSDKSDFSLKIDEINIDSFFDELGLEKTVDNSFSSENEYDSSIENSLEEDLDINNNELVEEQKIEDALLELQIVGMIFNTYIIAESNKTDSIFIIDQHAAHERVMYERFKEEYNKESIATQQILTPEIIELTTSEMDVFLENKKLFNDLGFIIEEFGENSIAIRGYPLLFGKPEGKDMFIQIFDNLDFSIDTSYELKIEKIMKISCVNAIKGGDKLDKLEVEALFNDLIKCEVPYTCPHGRPTMIEMTKKELEKEFFRIM